MKTFEPFSDESNNYFCQQYIDEATVFYWKKMLKLVAKEAVAFAVTKPHNQKKNGRSC